MPMVSPTTHEGRVQPFLSREWADEGRLLPGQNLRAGTGHSRLLLGKPRCRFWLMPPGTSCSSSHMVRSSRKSSPCNPRGGLYHCYVATVNILDTWGCPPCWNTHHPRATGLAAWRVGVLRRALRLASAHQSQGVLLTSIPGSPADINPRMVLGVCSPPFC